VIYHLPILTYGCRFVVSGTPSTLPVFEQALFQPCTIILQQDIDRTLLLLKPSQFSYINTHSEYIPYVFQILAQMLELHATDVPGEYVTLLPFLLTPAIWQQKGSIPGLVKLLKAFLAKKRVMAHDQLTSVLAIIQQRLIPSKINDGWGFELLHSVIQNVPS
jgi:exportin-2 (importin alpha re-exporter)